MFCRTGAGTLLLWGHPPDSFPGVITASGIVTSLPFQSECGLSSENPPPCLGWAQDRQSTTGPREALFPEEPGRRVQPGSQASLPSPPDPVLLLWLTVLQPHLPSLCSSSVLPAQRGYVLFILFGMLHASPSPAPREGCLFLVVVIPAQVTA